MCMGTDDGTGDVSGQHKAQREEINENRKTQQI